MYDTVIILVLLFPWSIIVLTLLARLHRRVRKAGSHSR